MVDIIIKKKIDLKFVLIILIIIIFQVIATIMILRG